MPTRRRASIHLGLAHAAILALGLSLGAPAVLAASRAVDIEDFAFAPQTVEVTVGDTVTWTNRDGVAHTATAQNGSFDTGLLAEGESGSVRFTAAGTYQYLCTPHPSMTGTVVVRSAGTVAPPNTATGPASVSSPTADARLAFLAIVGGAGFLFAERLLRRRRSAS